MVKLKDIADAAGVGIATVSRYLNGSGYVSEEACEKIQNAMEHLGYGKKRKQTQSKNIKLIGVVVPYIEHPFFSNMVQSLESELLSRGYRMVLISERNIPARQYEALEMLYSGELDGIINFGNMPLDFKGRQGKALVSFDRKWTDEVPLIRCNHVLDGKMAAEEFLRHGKKNIVFFVGGQDLSRSANVRYLEAQKVLEAHGGNAIMIFQDWDALSYSYNKYIIERYKELLMEADGCLTTDIGALCCQVQLQQLGVRIPEDFLIISFDGTGIIDIGTPPLPAICQDSPSIAKVCAEVLERMLRQEVVDSLYEVKPVWRNRMK